MLTRRAYADRPERAPSGLRQDRVVQLGERDRIVIARA
jgi:hypothetical protein